MSHTDFLFPDLKGRSVLLTGVTRGIGRALLPFLFGQQMKVIGLGRGRDRLKNLRRELGDPADFHTVDCDLSDPSQVERAAGEVFSLGMALDAVIQNAAIDPRERFARAERDFWMRVFQVNFFSAVELTRRLLPLLRQSEQGRIILLGSVLLDLGGGCCTTYVASKGAVSGLATSLAHELKHTMVTVNTIVPGAVVVEKEDATEEMDQRLIDWQCMPRRLVTADLAGLICFLLSRCSGGITGQSITVDGGLVHPLAFPENQGKNLTPPWGATEENL
jgi:NAD(P)-dependent dehydrogenase (short-subunit alcohol dehydrogenase family)